MRKLFLAWPLLFFCLLTSPEARAQTDGAPPQQTSPTAEKLAETTNERAAGEPVAAWYAPRADAPARPEDAASYYRLCRRHVEAEKASDALAACQHAAKLKPDYGQAFFTLGKLYERNGRAREAAAAFERVVELQPDNADALMELG